MKEAGDEGSALINQKLEIVKNYYQTTWNIDLEKMRRTLWRRQDDVVKGRINLTDITVY
jgi:hypothetical protein